MNFSNRLHAKQITEMLLQMAPHTELARHDPGRIKFRLLWSGISLLDTIDFEALMESIPGIIDARIQLLSRTVVIDYDEDQLPAELWEDVARLNEEPQLAENVRSRLRSLMESATA